jgi:PTS system mannose-specific IIC component
MTEILLLAAVGAVLALDSVHVAQVMISRPVVVGPVAGWILGDAATGLWVGALVELVWISVLPIGPYTPPDATVATLAAVAAAVPWAGPEGGGAPAAVAAGIVVGVPVGIAGRKADVLLRRRLTRASERILAELEAGRVPSPAPAVLEGLAGTAAKTFLLVLGVGLAAEAVAGPVRDLLGRPVVGRGLAAGAALLPAVGIATVTDLLEVRRHRRAYLLGAAVAAAAWVLAPHR